MTQSKDTLLMEELSWTEIADRLDDGYTEAILACGAIEQHGPHLPTGVDTYLGYALAEEIAANLGNALVAPTLRPGCSDHHMNFPGTFTISKETFRRLLTEYCESLAATGFDYIWVFPSHGGNIDVMQTYIPDIANELPDTDVYFLDFGFEIAFEYLEEEYGIPKEIAGVHAGFEETARMLADYGDLVDMTLAEEGMTLPEFYEEDRKQESFTHGIDAQSPNGILGDPRDASAEHGDEIREVMGKAMAEQILHRKEVEVLTMDVPDSIAHEYD